jgi:colanic acid/amylovoran biosynthesis glycosyltransferase
MPNLTATQMATPKKKGIAKVAHIVSAFPTVEETFVLYEMIEMEKLGITSELFPLRRLRVKITHPEAVEWVQRAHYRPFLSWSVLRAQWHFIRRDLTGYLKLWAEMLRAAWGSADYFFGTIVIFPKTVLFAQEMVEQGIAHVHAQFASHAATAALIIHRLTGIPFSFTARGTDVQVYRQMLREKIEAAQSVIAVSSDNRNIMAAECGPHMREKIRVIHGGVDVERLAPNIDKRVGKRFRILCVARFEEVKGHAYLIEACRLLRLRGVAFECRLVGDGALADNIKKQIGEAKLEDAVRLLGWRAYPDVVQELRQADVVALPTAPTANGKREGSPTVLKEAMSCGLPVVSSPVGGIPELVENERTGLLVAPRDASALADALQRLIGDKALREQLGRAAREKVVRDFNLRTNTVERAELFLGRTLDKAADREFFYEVNVHQHIDSQAPAAPQSA